MPTECHDVSYGDYTECVADPPLGRYYAVLVESKSSGGKSSWIWIVAGLIVFAGAAGYYFLAMKKGKK